MRDLSVPVANGRGQRSIEAKVQVTDELSDFQQTSQRRKIATQMRRALKVHPVSVAAIDFNVVAKHESSGTMANEINMCRGRSDTAHFSCKILGAAGKALVRRVLEAKNTEFRIRIHFGHLFHQWFINAEIRFHSMDAHEDPFVRLNAILFGGL
ncbi:hypothetical protein Poly41_68540 [Novipirellula artificiosorum]|uniref:Uncharacterized protein n=1 Tax=Novipirellula artificiosorum TaxID=2528016 RepID=A0A5C6CV71_9BACT|nr:hypothetical protein Poly41_68540 [Novipirellula artificiosorum]